MKDENTLLTFDEKLERVWNFHKSHNNGVMAVTESKKLVEETSKEKDEEFKKILDWISNDVDGLQMNYANLDECKKVDVIKIIDTYKQKLEGEK